MADHTQMAERPQTPVLPSTADASPYVPVSWMAVSAVVVAGLFLVVLIGLGLWDYFVEKKPLLLKELLVFPLVAVVLSFAGRRLIRNSEGTRTGEKLCNTAWWVSVIGGLSFVAYMMAIDFAYRRDAKDEGQRWVSNVLGDDSARMAAFIETLEPDRRGGLSPASPGQLESEFRDQLTEFKQCDLVKLAMRNPGNCRIEGEGVKDWTTRQNVLDCAYTAKVTCREGVFDILVPVRGIEYGSGTPNPGRKWMVPAQSSVPMILPDAARTPYGWLVAAVEQSALQFGRDFFGLVGTGSPNHPLIYHMFVGPKENGLRIANLQLTHTARIALAGGPTGLAPLNTKESADYFRSAFFKLPGGAEPSQFQKDDFRRAWDSAGLLPPATRLKSAPERIPMVAFGENAIEMKFPCELPIPGPDLGVCKCRLIVTLNDPAVIAELQKLRAEANPSQATRTPPENIQPMPSEKWKLIRVESDMNEIKSRPTGKQQGQQ